MPRLFIDEREIEVSEGTTVLQAAQTLGIEIPHLCWREGFAASTSCMVCVVRVDGAPSLSPSCATLVREGMRVESESEEVRAARRTAIELLLSDHTGDCMAPCHMVAPGGLDLPRIIHGVAEGDVEDAVRALRAQRGESDTTRPERACRRGRHDEPVDIGRIVEFVEKQAGEQSTEQDAPPEDPPAVRGFSVRLGGLREGELERFLEGASPDPRIEPADPEAGYTAEEARREARRCLHCDCCRAHGCKLRDYAEDYGARPGRFRAPRRDFEQVRDHPDVIFEPGKCILCGLCLQVAERHGEELGLSFTGRGFEMRIGVPFEEALSRALQRSALECAEVCPTAAIVRRPRG